MVIYNIIIVLCVVVVALYGSKGLKACFSKHINN
jgi:hypothetical protein